MNKKSALRIPSWYFVTQYKLEELNDKLIESFFSLTFMIHFHIHK